MLFCRFDFCHIKFSSMSISSDLVVHSCLTGILSIETSTCSNSDSVPRFYIEPVNIKYVLVVFRVTLFQIRHLLI